MILLTILTRTPTLSCCHIFLLSWRMKIWSRYALYREFLYSLTDWQYFLHWSAALAFRVSNYVRILQLWYPFLGFWRWVPRVWFHEWESYYYNFPHHRCSYLSFRRICNSSTRPSVRKNLIWSMMRFYVLCSNFCNYVLCCRLLLILLVEYILTPNQWLSCMSLSPITMQLVHLLHLEKMTLAVSVQLPSQCLVRNFYAVIMFLWNFCSFYVLDCQSTSTPACAVLKTECLFDNCCLCSSLVPITSAQCPSDDSSETAFSPTILTPTPNRFHFLRRIHQRFSVALHRLTCGLYSAR